MVRAYIVSTGMAVPDRVLTNHDLEKIVDTSDAWIRERTGMAERHVSDENTAASDLALPASRDALRAAGISPDDLDAILVATISGDYVFPATACVLQHKLGASHAMAFDLSAACTGYIYGLSVAQAYIESGRYKNILLVGVDMLTKVVDWTDRNTCVLFGDGAGATVIQPRERGGVLDTVLGSDGSAAELLYQPCGGTRVPISHEAIDRKKHFLYMNGREIYKYAVREMVQSCHEVLKRCGKTIEDVRLIIPHQANNRILEAVAQRLGVSMDRLFINIEKYANTSAATVPIALHEALQQGRLHEGDLALLVSFGGGLTWGASLVQF
ncbi:MAG TPA: beta-ketoacyl-ACP synthase III [bacterium]|nr:ketoacyl-ACP synthase III [Candidatus Omnitrophota bacterium]HOJ60068.1 beta-ketoacyl-ACP synthase III [bacterium]HOL94870.1 beta-ketoacyl-ACP synthase III [bacterium]HPO99730.1 beta-ketoacyl-ACP synthase III [bacterium]